MTRKVSTGQGQRVHLEFTLDELSLIGSAVVRDRERVLDKGGFAGGTRLISDEEEAVVPVHQAILQRIEDALGEAPSVRVDADVRADAVQSAVLALYRITSNDLSASDPAYARIRRVADRLVDADVLADAVQSAVLALYRITSNDLSASDPAYARIRRVADRLGELLGDAPEKEVLS